MKKPTIYAKTPSARHVPLNEAAIIQRLSLISIIGNTALSGFKLFAGLSGHSGAMLSDAIHSLSDVLTTVIAWVGVKISRKGADASHPYGHERFECVASLILGLVLLATGIGVGKVGVTNIIAKEYEILAIPSTVALIAAVVSILGKEAMYWYTRHYAKIINSAAFMADAWHHRSDAFSSIGSFIGIGGAMLGYPILDSVASVVICLFIVKVAFDILKDAVTKMLDTSCGDDYDKELAAHVAEQDGVVGVDMVRSRMFGSKVYVDVEISVNGTISLRDAHEISERVHKDIEQRFVEVKHIMVHVNPAEI